MKDFFKKGQVPLPLVFTVGTMIAGSVMWVYNMTFEVKADVSEVSERTAVLETSVKNTDKNVQEIKDDLKDIKRALNVK